MLKVVVHEKGGRTQRFNFETDQFSVGREDDNDLVLDRVNISKYHLRFRRHQGRVEVMDLGSTNGTYVNGRKVDQPRAVRRSDRIYVGDYILMLEGDEPSISPVKRSDVVVAGHEAHPQTRAVAVPPPQLDDGEALATSDVPTPLSRLIDDDSDLLTSARRVAPAGVDSTYLDRIANRVLQTVLVNVAGLDPLRVPEVSDEDRQAAITLVDGLLRDMERAGELEEGVAIDALRDEIVRELVELGPLTELMKDERIREIQVAGAAAIRAVRERVGGGAEIELTSRRFSGDRAVVLAVHRMARKWGFLVEGSQVLEGKVDDGFSMYALLPPTQVRSPVLNLRRHRTDANNLTSLVQEGVLSPDMAELVGDLAHELRVACISDSGRLGAGRRGWLQVRRIADPSDTLGLSDALGVLLRGGLDMLVSQRCRHEDAAAVMDAFAGATRGAIVSLWGIDSAHALWRLAGLSTVAAGAIGALTVSLARSVDLLIRLNVGVNQEAMQVVELIEPRVKAGDQIVHVPIFQAERDADKTTVFRPTGEVPSFIAALAEQGIAVPTRMFTG